MENREKEKNRLEEFDNIKCKYCHKNAKFLVIDYYFCQSRNCILMMSNQVNKDFDEICDGVGLISEKTGKLADDIKIIAEKKPLYSK